MKVRLSLVMLLIVGIVFAGIGLMVYFYVLKEESHPLAGPMFVGLLILGLAMIVFLMIRSARNMKELGEITAVKERMSDMNESTMFVTFFCGVIDMNTGHLRYCNAGHDAPMLLTKQ